jgi:putative flippase GtrA
MADRSNLTQMLRFVCVGVGVAVFFMFLTYALVSGGAPPFWASVLAYVICFVIAYLLHTFWTFEAKHPPREALPKYLALQVSCAVFSGLVPQVAVDHFGATHLVAGRACGFNGQRPQLFWVDALCLPQRASAERDMVPGGRGDGTAG